ncbi:MAG: HD domain-containing protein [Halobacteriaceae archaeon]
MTDHRERDLFQRVAAAAEPRFGDDAAHDRHHAWRVFELATRIAEAEGGDVEVVGAAALVHDLHRAREDGGEFVHPRETLPEVREVLDEAGYPVEKVGDVCHCVAVHEEYDFEADPDAAETLEAEILQDADNLDALGAVGVARAFAYGGARGNRLWDPDRPLPDGPYEKSGGADGGPGSTYHHVHAKLLRLHEHVNTETGRDLAAERHAFLEAFATRFEEEWRGER